MDIFKYIPVPDEFKHLEVSGRLLSPASRAKEDVNCAFIRKDETFIELEDSHRIFRYIQMPDNLLLGYDISWRCCDTYQWYGRDIDRQNQCGIWNLNTGRNVLKLKGLHYGSPLGVQLLDDKRMITWGEDFLINVWDRNTGDCLEKIPVGVGTRSDYRYPEPDDDEKLKEKIWRQEIDQKSAEHHMKMQAKYSDEEFDEYMEREAKSLEKKKKLNEQYRDQMRQIFKKYGNVPFVKSDTFSGWTDERRKNYVDNRQELSFNLRFILPNTGENIDPLYAEYQGSNPEHIEWRKYDGYDIWDCFDELTEVNAGYSFDQKLKDGRLFVTGESYGLSDKGYIWDGGLNLTMLLQPALNSPFSCAEGQEDDGAISYDFGSVKFYGY